MVQRFPPRSAFYVLFIVSGFAGLIYESVWTHYLKLYLGHAAYAQSLVLIVFMGGMALGSWFCSRYSGRWLNLLIGYAVAEGAIGLLALPLGWILRHLLLMLRKVFRRDLGTAREIVMGALRENKNRFSEESLLGNLEEAQQDLRQAWELRPGDPQTGMSLARALAGSSSSTF